MPDNDATVVLQNNKTGALEARPLDSYRDDIASGRYSKTSGSVVRTERMGATVASEPGLGQAYVKGGEAFDPGITAAYEAGAARQRAAFDTRADKVEAFAKGLVDMASVGLLKNDSEYNRLQADVNSGSAFAGQAVGLLGSFAFGGPVSRIAKGGTALAERAITKTLLGEIAGGGKAILARSIEEAGANAAMMGAQSLGNQISGVVINDHEFSGEAVLHETGMGGLFGFGFGAVGGIAKHLKGASRAEVAAQGGILDLASAESKSLSASVKEGIGTFDDVLSKHEAKLNIAEVLAKEGRLPQGAMAPRRALMNEAQAAERKLASLDAEAALAGTDLKASKRWIDAMEDYQAKVVALDESMALTTLELAARTEAKLGAAGEIKAPKPHNTQIEIDRGDMSAWGNREPVSFAVDRRMEAPGMAEAFEKIHGRPWEPMDQVLMREAEGAENLGGKVSATSESGTRAGKLRPSLEASAESPSLKPAVTAEENGNAFKQALDDLARFDKQGAAGRAQGKAAVERFIDDWHAQSSAMGPKVSPADTAAAKLQALMDDIKVSTGGKLDAAAAINLFQAQGIKPAATTFGSQIEQIIAARQLGRAVADASHGAANVADKAGDSWMKSWFGGLPGAVGRNLGRRAMAGVAGSAVGGPVGAILGAVFANKVLGFTGKVAGASGRMSQQIAGTVDTLLSGGRGVVAARVAGSAFENRPVAYSDVGPIEDPTKRILEVQRLAANPEALAAWVKEKLGDTSLLHPEIADSVVRAAQGRMQRLAFKAPAIVFSALGDPQAPSTQALRRWLSYENAENDYQGALRAIESGAANEAQYDAIREQPVIHTKLVQGLLSDPDRLKDLPRDRLRVIERVVGVPLSQAADPAFVARQQEAWKVHAAMQPNNPGAITPPTPTPSQAGARAPGN